jgi:flagellar hook-associated protein 3 FlgL
MTRPRPSSCSACRRRARSCSQIALQGNSITSNESFDSYAAEVSGLIEQAISAGNQQYNGSYVMGGTQSDVAPFQANRDSSGAVGSVNYVGASSGAPIQVGPNTSIIPTTDGSSGGSFATFINQLVSLRTALTNHDATSVASIGASINTSEDSIINLNGAVQARLQAIQTSLSNSFSGISTRISDINDVDIASASVQLTKSQTAYQAAIQTAAKVMSHSLLDYLQ